MSGGVGEGQGVMRGVRRMDERRPRAARRPKPPSFVFATSARRNMWSTEGALRLVARTFQAAAEAAAAEAPSFLCVLLFNVLLF